MGVYTSNGTTNGTLSGCTVSDITLSCTDEKVAERAKMGYVSGGMRTPADTGKVTVTEVTVSGENTGSNMSVNAGEIFGGTSAIAMVGDTGFSDLAEAIALRPTRQKKWLC